MSTVCKGSLMQFFMPYPLRTSILQDLRIRQIWPLRWQNERPVESEHNWCQHQLRGLRQYLHLRQGYLWLQSLQLRRPKLPLLSGPEPSMLLLTYWLLRSQSHRLQQQVLWPEEWLDVKWPKRKLGLFWGTWEKWPDKLSAPLLAPRLVQPWLVARRGRHQHRHVQSLQRNIHSRSNRNQRTIASEQLYDAEVLHDSVDMRSQTTKEST